MRPEFDVVIVGSGPAGVSAAFPLVEAGLKVLMVDGGRRAPIGPPGQPFLTARAGDAAQAQWMLGADLQALRARAAVSPKFRVPGLGYVFADFAAQNRIAAEDFVTVGSLAVGGLSNAWGCGVARLSDHELAALPVPATEMARSYATVAKRVGLSGAGGDALSGYFGVDDWSQPPIELDALSRRLHDKYLPRAAVLGRQGFRLGRSRVAVLSAARDGRAACTRCGNCLYGCSGQSMYSAVYDLEALRRHANFRHDSLLVTGVLRHPAGWGIRGHDPASGFERTVRARRVVLAAGTLATTRLAMRLLDIHGPLDLLSNPTAAFMLWLPGLVGSAPAPSFGLGQLSHVLALQEGSTAFGSTFSITGISRSEFLPYLPFGRRSAIGLLRGMASSCLVGNLFLSGDLSMSTVSLGQDGQLKVAGAYGERVAPLMVAAASGLRRAFRRLGAVILPGSFRVGRPGADVHYCGTLPMRARPATVAQTDALGTLPGCAGLHIADGACLPVLTEKSHTLTIMANADRIGRAIAAAIAP